MENTEKKKILQELEGLLDLAEKTSDKSTSYNLEARNYFASIQWIIILFILYITSAVYLGLSFEFRIEYQITVTIISIAGIVIGINFILAKYRVVNELRRKSKIEREVLLELLDMIHEIKKMAFNENEMSSIDKALLEMRLKRISYSNDYL